MLLCTYLADLGLTIDISLIFRGSHIKYTIPPALALTILLRPLLARVDWYKILFLVSVSFLSMFSALNCSHRNHRFLSSPQFLGIRT